MEKNFVVKIMIFYNLYDKRSYNFVILYYEFSS